MASSSFPVELLPLGEFDQIPIAEILKNLFLLGLAVNIDDPQRISLTMDAFLTEATLTPRVLQGGQGNSGDDSFVLHFEDHYITDLDQLPTDLGDTQADLGRFWLYPVVDPATGNSIATTIYVWTGERNGILSGTPGLGRGWIQVPVGTPGSPGVYPDITPNLVVQAVGSGLGPNDSDSWVAVTTVATQVLTIDGTPTAGGFTLTAHINGVSDATSSVVYNGISASSLHTALGALGNVGSGNVTVTQIPAFAGASSYLIAFGGTIDPQTVSLMTKTSTLTGAAVLINPAGQSPAQTFNLAVPKGIDGPSSPFGAFADVDLQTNRPSSGDNIVCSNRVTPGVPTSLGVTGHTIGGTLAAGTYHYVVTATVPNGETLPSNEVSVTTTGSTSSVTLNWTEPTGNGATGYNIYRGPAGAENVLVAVIVSGTIVSFVDTGTPTTAATVPTSGVTAGKPIWVPQTPNPTVPTLYTVPESAFTTVVGINFLNYNIGVGGVNVLTFIVPPQDFSWVPFVFGQVKISGANLSLTPLAAAAQVHLGGPGGQVVASGNGNTLGTITMVSDLGGESVTPTANIALVPSNQSATLSVSLINQGLIGLYDVSGQGAGLSVLCIPVEPPTEAILPTGIISAEAFGSMGIEQFILLVGMTSAEAFGTSTVRVV